jgi:hypothetical protein
MLQNKNGPGFWPGPVHLPFWRLANHVAVANFGSTVALGDRSGLRPVVGFDRPTNRIAVNNDSQFIKMLGIFLANGAGNFCHLICSVVDATVMPGLIAMVKPD